MCQSKIHMLPSLRVHQCDAIDIVEQYNSVLEIRRLEFLQTEL